MLNPDIEATTTIASHALDEALAVITKQTAEIVERATTRRDDIPTVITYFAELREKVEHLAKQTSALTKHVDALSREAIPTLFTNASIKSINVIGIGRTTINVRWSASMLNKEAAFGWCKQTGNEGLIIQTINAQTLAAFAKTEALAGRPLPDDVFKVSTTSHVSITPTED